MIAEYRQKPAARDFARHNNIANPHHNISF